MARRRFSNTGWAIGLIASTGLLGCASTGDLDALSAQVAELESQHKTIDGRIAGLESGVAEANANAGAAIERASAAEREAAAAAASADDAARRADAMFKKSVSK